MITNVSKKTGISIFRVEVLIDLETQRCLDLGTAVTNMAELQNHCNNKFTNWNTTFIVEVT
jgi:hypothetical protein